MLLQELLKINESKQQKYTDVDSFVERFSQYLHSMFDVWMQEEEQVKLFNLYKENKKIISKSFDIPKHAYEPMADVITYINKKEKLGFTLFAQEDNYDQTEVLMYK